MKKNRPVTTTLKIAITVAIAAITLSCHKHSGNHNHDHFHSHNHDQHNHDEKLQLTAYSQLYEIYLEATPFVAGKSSRLLTHITLIENFKPLQEGAVTVTLTVDGSSISKTVDQPEQPGIYLFDIEPESTGDGLLTYSIKTEEDDNDKKIAMPPIKIYSESCDAYDAAAEEMVVGINSSHFTKEQSWKIDFATEEIVEEQIGEVIKATGQVRSAPDDEHVIVSSVSGILQFSGKNLVEGSYVTAGEYLFTVDGSKMADNNLTVRLTEAESEYFRTKAEYSRKSELAKDRIVTESELLKAEAEYKNAEANMNNLKRLTSSGSHSVTAPVTGYIKHLSAKNGELLNAGEPVMVITQNRNLIVQAELQPKYFELLQHVSRANIRTTESNRTYSFSGRANELITYSRATDRENPLIKVTLPLKDTDTLLPGSFVELYLISGGERNMVGVPNGAIFEEMGNYFIYLQLTPELFEKRPIKRGLNDGVRTEIVEGLKVGDRVVTEGAIMIKLSQATGAIDPHSGHVH